MENKDPIKITSVIITFIIFLSGAVLCFWLYTNVINSPSSSDSSKQTKIEVDSTKLDSIQSPSKPAVSTPADGYGRSNPFMPYK